MIDMGQDAVFEAVRKAWTETMPKTAFDPDISWEDAGADSMKSLQLLMRLEQALDQKISFELLSSEMNARDMARALAQSASPRGHSPTLPRLFLIPGIYGDAPALGRFRREMAETVNVELIDLPGLDLPVKVHRDIGETAVRVTGEIVRQDLAGAIALGGFSFGGVIAFEAARLLRERGHDIAVLVLIDTHLGIEPSRESALIAEAHPGRGLGRDELKQASRPNEHTRRRSLFGRYHRVSPRSAFPYREEGLSGYWDRMRFALYARIGLMDRARGIARKPTSPQQRVWRTKVIMGSSRYVAMQKWRPKPLDVPMHLFQTQDGEKMGIADRWRQLCPRLEVTNLPYPHLRLLEAEPMALLKEKLTYVLAAALT